MLPFEHELGRTRICILLLNGALAAFTTETIARYARLFTHILQRARLLYLELHLSLRFLLQALVVHLLAYCIPVQVHRGEITRRLVLILLYVEHERVRVAVTVKFGMLSVVDSRVDALV